MKHATNKTKFNYINVTHDTPCPICGRPDWCRISDPPGRARCRRESAHPIYGQGKPSLDSSGDYWFYNLSKPASGASAHSTHAHYSAAANTEKKTLHTESDNKTAPPLNASKLHEILTALLLLCPLSESHKTALRQRGLKESTIAAGQYGSLPPNRRAAIARALIKQFGAGNATRTPGIYLKTDAAGKQYYSLAGAAGLLIPVRNTAGQITALKIRVDDAATAEKYGKYLSLSSARKPSGTPATDATHFTSTAEQFTEYGSSALWITEGELKADVAAEISADYYLSIPGTAKWRMTIPSIHTLGAKNIILAFDNDCWTNPQVAQNLSDFYEALSRDTAIKKVTIADWRNQPHKGIDDLLHAGGTPAFITGEAAAALIHEITASAQRAKPSTTQRAVTTALETLSGFTEKHATDPGYPFEPQIAEALHTLESHSPRDWQTFKAALKKRGQLTDMNRLFKQITERRAAQAIAANGFPGSSGSALPNNTENAADIPFSTDGSHTGQIIPLNANAAAAAADLPTLQASLGTGTPPLSETLKPLTIPQGWAASPLGVEKFIIQGNAQPVRENVLPVPAAVIKRIRDLATDTRYVEITWLDGNRWRNLIVKRSAVADARSIIKLSDFGFPVNSETARNASTYLCEFEAQNVGSLQFDTVTTSAGWIDFDGTENAGFLLNNRFITDTTAPTDIRYMPENEGDEQILAGIQSRGTLSEWCEAIKPIAAFPRALVPFYAAFAAPMLKILECPSFIVDLAGTTSGGKTIALRIAASVWGNPDERKRNAYMRTWGQSPVWIERAASVFNNSPLILDDTKQYRRPDKMSEVIYNFAAGQGRGRGAIFGTQRSTHWNTVMISSGEQVITSLAKGDAGTRGRVLSLWSTFGAFDKISNETARLINDIDWAIKEHYGHAAAAFIESLLENRDQWAGIREQFRIKQREYIARARDLNAGREDAIAGRLCEYIAAIDMAGTLAHQAIPLGWDYHEAFPFRTLFREIISEAVEADQAKHVFCACIDWAFANAALFISKYDDEDRYFKSPASGWAGKWDTHPERADWEYIAFHPERLRVIVENFGYCFDSICRQWSDRGYLLTGDDRKKRTTKTIKVFGSQIRMIAFSRDSIESIYGKVLNNEPDFLS